jgi:hypothetical protein
MLNVKERGSKVLCCAQRVRNLEGGLDGSGCTLIGDNPQRSAVLRSTPTTSAQGCGLTVVHPLPWRNVVAPGLGGLGEARAIARDSINGGRITYTAFSLS